MIAEPKIAATSSGVSPLVVLVNEGELVNENAPRVVRDRAVPSKVAVLPAVVTPKRRVNRIGKPAAHIGVSLCLWHSEQ